MANVAFAYTKSAATDGPVSMDVVMHSAAVGCVILLFRLSMFLCALWDVVMIHECKTVRVRLPQTILRYDLPSGNHPAYCMSSISSLDYGKQVK